MLEIDRRRINNNCESLRCAWDNAPCFAAKSCFSADSRCYFAEISSLACLVSVKKRSREDIFSANSLVFIFCCAKSLLLWIHCRITSLDAVVGVGVAWTTDPERKEFPEICWFVNIEVGKVGVYVVALSCVDGIDDLPPVACDAACDIGRSDGVVNDDEDPREE